MRIAVPKELTAGEERVPIVPDSVKRLGQKKSRSRRGGRRRESRVSDADYTQEGATVEAS